MDIDELRRLIVGAPPGTEIRVVSIVVPLPPGCTSACPAPPSATREFAGGPEDLFEALGGEPRKLKEWAKLIPGLSARELDRAARDGTLECHRKTTGKDHGAKVALPHAIRRYLLETRGGGAPVGGQS